MTLGAILTALACDSAQVAKPKVESRAGGVYKVTTMPHTRENALKHTLKIMFGKLYLWHPCNTCGGTGMVKMEEEKTNGI